MNEQEQIKARKLASEYFRKAGITLTEQEKCGIEIADFGLNDICDIGLQILVYINTERVCAKELVLFPNQACVEHKHPPFANNTGKEETFRCRWGEVFLYLPGEPAKDIDSKIPEKLKGKVSVFREVHLRPGEQYTLEPNTLHWFKAGLEGAVVSEFSSKSSDSDDIFTDTDVVRN